jgi:hypothetical protein
MEVHPSNLIYPAVELEKEDLIRALLRRYDKEVGNTALFKAVALKNEKMVRFLLGGYRNRCQRAKVRRTRSALPGC